MEITKEFLINAMENRVFLKTRLGRKVIISLFNENDENDPYPFIGIEFDHKDMEDFDSSTWTIDGKYYNEKEDHSSDIIGLWEESIKPEPFNLERALNGEPVLLRNGLKAEILKALDKPDAKGFQYFGLSLQTQNGETWYHEQAWNKNFKGSILLNDTLTNYDIVGMWQEPKRPTVTLTLPCPLKSLDGVDTAYLAVIEADKGKDAELIIYEFSKENFHEKRIQEQLILGNLFASKEDAKAWELAKQNNRR